jgi:hypothetical protein
VVKSQKIIKRKILLKRENKLPRNSMVNALSTTRLDIWLRIAKIKLNKETLKRKGLPKTISSMLITSIMKF